MSAYNLALYVYGPPIAVAIVLATVLGVLSWLVEYLVGHTTGVYAGYLALLAIVVLAGWLCYGYAVDCKGLFGAAVILPRCEWALLSLYTAVALIAIAVPLLIFSQARLRRWSRHRALLTH